MANFTSFHLSELTATYATDTEARRKRPLNFKSRVSRNSTRSSISNILSSGTVCEENVPVLRVQKGFIQLGGRMTMWLPMARAVTAAEGQVGSSPAPCRRLLPSFHPLSHFLCAVICGVITCGETAILRVSRRHKKMFPPNARMAAATLDAETCGCKDEAFAAAVRDVAAAAAAVPFPHLRHAVRTCIVTVVLKRGF